MDIPHVRANHFPGGSGVKPGKDLWPSDITNDELEGIARQAFNNNPKIVGYDKLNDMIQARSVVNGIEVQFQIPRSGGLMRSIYPLAPWRRNS